MSKEDNTNLFRVLERGDRTVQTAHQTAIMLVGLTRAGKSTTFNWILDRSMIGKGDEVDAHYETIVNDVKTAQLGSTFTSVTLCPNIVDLDKEKGLSIIDMAGYKDKRNYVGVLGVSYFLKAVFERVRKVKFVIVIDEQKLMENSGEGLMNTFTGFLSMFNLREMLESQRNAFYSSVSMVVTRSERQNRHYGSLSRTLTMVKDQKLIVENKPELMRLLSEIIKRNCIEAFPIAISNQNPPKCDFLARFERLGWDYLDVSAVQQEMGTDLITVPFISDFAGLPLDQQNLFNTVIQARVNSYTHFARIVDTLIQGVRQGWESSLEQWKLTGELSLNLNQCDAVFNEVVSFLNVNDFYNSEDLVAREIRSEYKPLNFVKKIKQVIKVFHVGDIIGTQEDHKFIESMNFYSKQFGDLIDMLVPFASNGDEEHLLGRLSFIVRRGFRDFSKLYQLNDRIINDVNHKMKDNLNDVFLNRRKFIEIFVTQINSELLPKLFHKLEDLLEYEDFFNDYQNEFYNQQNPIFFSRHRYDIEVAKADLFLANYQKQRAMHCYIRAFKYQCEIAFSASHSYDQQDQAEAQLNHIHMKKLELVGNLITILKGLKEVPEACDFALVLAKYVKNIHESCQIYEILIAKAKPSLKLELISDFVEYCLDWGRLQQANVLLQRKLSLEKSNFESYMATILKITELAKNKGNLTDRYMQNLSGWTRLPEDDPVINGYLGDLEIIIPDQ